MMQWLALLPQSKKGTGSNAARSFLGGVCIFSLGLYGVLKNRDIHIALCTPIGLHTQ